MLLVAEVQESKRLPLNDTAGGLSGIELLKVKRSVVPAITHVDYSARVQTVDADRHGRYYRLIKALKEKTGCPLVINTSFNIRGEPIVCTPENAFHCFQSTNMDVLVLEDIVVFKDEQPQMKPVEINDYLARFELD